MNDRQRFEEFCQREWPGVSIKHHTWDDQYFSVETQQMWESWQAATAACAALCDDMVLYTGLDCAAAIRARGE